jgi:hypothetical protein
MGVGNKAGNVTGVRVGGPKATPPARPLATLTVAGNQFIAACTKLGATASGKLVQQVYNFRQRSQLARPHLDTTVCRACNPIDMQRQLQVRTSRPMIVQNVVQTLKSFDDSCLVDGISRALVSIFSCKGSVFNDLFPLHGRGQLLLDGVPNGGI